MEIVVLRITYRSFSPNQDCKHDRIFISAKTDTLWDILSKEEQKKDPYGESYYDHDFSYMSLEEILYSKDKDDLEVIF